MNVDVINKHKGAWLGQPGTPEGRTSAKPGDACILAARVRESRTTASVETSWPRLRHVATVVEKPAMWIGQVRAETLRLGTIRN